jgi:hypothetical protein
MFASEVGVVAMTKRYDSSTDLPADEEQSNTSDMDRRKALGRLGLYTAPAMVALLLGQRAAVASPSLG